LDTETERKKGPRDINISWAIGTLILLFFITNKGFSYDVSYHPLHHGYYGSNSNSNRHHQEHQKTSSSNWQGETERIWNGDVSTWYVSFSSFSFI
jgi:hypothetical protein